MPFFTKDTDKEKERFKRIFADELLQYHFDGVTLSFQISKHLVERQVDDASNVLANDPTGSRLSNNPKHLWPEVTVILIAASLPGKTEWLAWESAREEIEVFNFIPIKLSDVVVDFRIFEILF